MPEENAVPMLTYDQARDVYEKAKVSPFFKDMSLPQFSAMANEITGTQQFAMGLNDNVLKQLNYKLNQASKALGGDWLGQAGRGAMEMVGLPEYGDIGQRIGEGVPRGLAETAALFVPGGQAALLPRLAGMGARLAGATGQGLQTYSATDSGKAGLFAGATSLLMPGAVHMAEAAVPKLFGKSLGLVQAPLSAVTQRGTDQTLVWTALKRLGGNQGTTQRVAQKTLEASARNLAFLGFGEAQMQGSQLLATGQLAPYTDEHLVELAASQLAFAPLDLLGITRSRVSTRTEQVFAQAAARQQSALDQRINAAVDEVRKSGPLPTKTERIVETLDDVEQQWVKKTIGITRSKLTKALQRQEQLDLDDLTTFVNPHGQRSPLRGKSVEAVQALVDAMVLEGRFKLEGTKLVPTANFDLSGQENLHLLDATGEAQKTAKVQREQQAQATAAAVLGKSEGGETNALQTEKGKEVGGAIWDSLAQGERMDYLDAAFGKTWRKNNPKLADWSLAEMSPELRAQFDDTGIAKLERSAMQGEAKGAQVAEGGTPEPKWYPREEGERIGPEGDIRTNRWRQLELRPSPPAPPKPSETTAQRAWRILETPGGAKAFAEEMSRNSPEGVQYTEMEARQLLVNFSRDFAQEAVRTVSAEAKAELERMSQLARATAEPVGKPVVKKPLETEPVAGQPEGYKGPMLQKDVTELPQADAADITNVTDVPSAQAFVNKYWEGVWRKVQGYAKRQVTKEVEVETPSGETETKPVTTTETVLARKPGAEGVDLGVVHEKLVDVALARLEKLGVKAERSDFSRPPTPDLLAQALGWDQVHPNIVTIEGRLRQVVKMIGDWYGIENATMDDLAEGSKARIQPDMHEQIEMADARIEQQLREAYRLSEYDPGLKNSLWQAEAEWQRDMDGITAVRRPVTELLEKVRNAMLRRVERLDKVIAERSEEMVQRALARMAQTTRANVSGELGVPQARMDEVMQVLDGYDRATVQRVTVKDADGKTIIKTTRGPIIQQLLRVLYRDETIKRKFKGGAEGTPQTAADMLNTLAAYRVMEWAARLVQGLEAYEAVQSGKATTLPPEANLFARYANLVTQQKGGLDKYKPATKEAFVSDVAHEALMDLVMIPNRTKSKFGKKSPAWEQYDVEGKTKWWQNESDAYAIAMADTEHAMSGGEAETFEGVNPYDVAAYEAAFGGKGGTIGAGTEMDNFFKRTFALRERFTPEQVKGMKLVRPVFNEDFTLNRDASEKSELKKSFSTEQTQDVAAELNATLDMLAEPEAWGLHVRQDPFVTTQGKKYKMSLELVPRTLANGRSEGRTAAQFRVIDKLDKVSPELRATHEFLMRADTTVADMIQASREVWQGEESTPEAKMDALKPLAKVLADNEVARKVGEGKRAKTPLDEEGKAAVRKEFMSKFVEDWTQFVNEKGTGRWFFKKYIDKLQSDYAAAVDSSYTNWQQKVLPRTLEAMSARAFYATQPEAKGAQVAGTVPKVGDERTAARVLLDEVTTEQQLTAGLWGHFNDHFQRAGASRAQASRYAEIAAKVGSAFPKLQHGTIVDLVDPRYGGTYVAQTSRKYLVGLNPEVFAKLPAGEKAAMMFHFAAHEVSHMLYSDLSGIDKLTAEQIAARRQNVLWAQSLGEEGRRAVLAQAFYAVLPIVKKSQLWDVAKLRFDVAAKDPNEFLVDLTGLSVLGLASPDPKARGQIEASYLMSDAHVQSVLQSVFVPLLDIAQPLTEYFEQRLPNKDVAQQFQRLVQGTKNVLNTTTDEINKQVAKLMQLQQAEPAVFFEAVGKGWRPDAALLGPEETKVFNHYTQLLDEVGHSETAGAAVKAAAKALWGASDVYESSGGGREVPMGLRWFFTAGQLAQKYPVLRPMFQLAFRYYGDANAAAQKIMGHMLRKRRLTGQDVLDYEGTGLSRVLQDQNVREAFDDIALLKQGTVEGGEDRRVLSDAEMRAVAAKHGVRAEEDVQAIINLHKNFEEAAPKIRQHTIDLLVRTLGVKIIGSELMKMDPTMSPDGAIAKANELGTLTWQAVTQGAPVVVQDPVLLKAANTLREALVPVKEFADRTAQNAEAWMPEVRIGRWKIAYWQKGKDGKWYGGVQSAKDKAERDAKLEVLKKREAADRDSAEIGQVTGIKPWDAWTSREDTNQGSPMWRLLNEMTQGSLQKRLIDVGVEQSTIAKVFDEHWSPLGAAMAAAEKKDVERMTKQRLLRPGRESLNMAQGFLHQANHIPRALSQMYADAEASLRLDAPELRGEGALRELARKHFRNVVHPQAAELTKLKKFIFAYFMGFNLSSILIEPTQQFIALLPSLTRDTGSATGAMRMWGKAAALALRRAKGKGKSGDADFDWALDEAQRQQVTDFGIAQEMYNAEDFGALNVASALSAGKPLWNAKRLATSVFDTYVNGARRFYSVAPQVNNVLAFSAAYITARDHGVFAPGTGKLQKLSRQEAFNYAAAVTQATMGGGGIAGRPVELFHGMGKATGVVGAMYSLATYSMLMMSHVARLGIDAVNRRGDLSPVERRAAIKALGQTLMTQGAFAGALGMPMATGMLAVLEQLFPGLKANEAVQDTVQKLVGEDEEMGGVLTDLVMRGVPNALLGVDTSSRLQLSNVLGVSQYDGFKLENLLGPTGSIVGNAFRAMQDAQQGKLADGVERLLPTAWKNIAQMYRDGWVVKDWKGRPMYEPKGHELALQMVGLKPNAVTKLRDAQKMAKRSTEVARAESGAFTDKLAQWLVDGEVQKVQQALLEQERKVAGYSAVEGARTVADKATKLLFPMDFAREGVRVDAQTRQKLALSGGVQATPETKWLETRKRLEGLLGIPGGGKVSRSEYALAMLVDQLRAQNPLLSVQEAREQAMLALGQRRPQGLQVQPGQMQF